MTLSVGQMSYNGVTLGPGGIAQIASVTGLTGMPTLRTGDVSRANSEGMLSGFDWYGTRQVTLNLEVTATPGGPSMTANLETLRQAFLKSTAGTGGANPTASQVLAFNFGAATVGNPGYNRRVAGRVRKLDDTVDFGFAVGGFTNGLVAVAALIECADPVIYDATTQTASIGLSIVTGGFTFPATFPATFGSQSGGLIFATNAGTVPCSPYMTITGPCLNPRVEQETTGVTVQFNMQLNTGDTLAVDCYSGSAVLNGTASRLNVLAPGSYITAFTLPPGSNTVGFFSSDATTTAAQLTMSWANTWA